MLKRGPRFDPEATYAPTRALFDVDDTLVSYLSTDLPTARFKEAVAAAKGKIEIGLASARPLAKVAHILEYLDCGGVCILSNGSQLYDPNKRQFIHESVLSADDVVTIVKHASERETKCWINDGGTDYFYEELDGSEVYTRQKDIWDKGSVRMPVDDYYPQKPLVIVLGELDEEELHYYMNYIKKFDRNTMTASIAHETETVSGKKYDILVAHPEANKLGALRKYAEYEGISLQEVLAVGDGRNDAILIGNVGTGVAMGNAARETMDMASFIAPNQSEDGAAVALEQFTKK